MPFHGTSIVERLITHATIVFHSAMNQNVSTQSGRMIETLIKKKEGKMNLNNLNKNKSFTALYLRTLWALMQVDDGRFVVFAIHVLAQKLLLRKRLIAYFATVRSLARVRHLMTL